MLESLALSPLFRKESGRVSGFSHSSGLSQVPRAMRATWGHGGEKTGLPLPSGGLQPAQPPGQQWHVATWFRFLPKLKSFFGKHLNEAQKGLSDKVLRRYSVYKG